jgi:ABC-type transport system substrate-binding protein
MIRRLTLFALTAVLAVVITSPWTAPARGQVPAAFRTPLTGEPPTLDPYFAVDSASAPAQRIAVYHKAEALAVEDGAMVPMLFTQFAYLKKPYVQGLQTTPAVNGWLPFSGVRIVK